MEPEVIANLWTFCGAFLNGQLNYQVGIRLYVATGSDDEKMAMLRALAAWDFHLAHIFPPSCGTTVLTGFPDGRTIEVEGVMPANAPGMEVMDWFQGAFDAIKTSLPEHSTPNGCRRAPLDLTNLLNVHTPIDVDKDGNMAARSSDPNLARSKPNVSTNLWAFSDSQSSAVHALAGRAYLLAGKQANVDRALKNLEANDWLLAPRLVVPESFSITKEGQSVAGQADVKAVSSQQNALFAPVWEKIKQDIPTLHTDWEKKKTHRYVLPCEQINPRVSVVPEGNGGNSRKTTPVTTRAHASSQHPTQQSSASNSLAGTAATERKWWQFWK